MQRIGNGRIPALRFLMTGKIHCGGMWGLKTIVDHIQVISPMKNLLQLKCCNLSPFTFFLHAWNAKVEISNDKLFRYLDRLEVQTACLAAIVRAVRAVRAVRPQPNALACRQEELDLQMEALDMRLVILK